MRPSSPETYGGSSTPPAFHRRKHRRRIPPSLHSSTDDHQERSSSSPNYQEEQEEDPEEVYETDGETQQYSSAVSAASSDSFPPSAYINVAPLPLFRGAPGECPVAHLSRFERVCLANNATAPATIIRIFPVTLDGEAALWYELAVEPHPSMPWPQIKAAFLHAYRPPGFADRARADLLALRQRPGERVAAYHLRLRWILKQWPDHGMPDAVLRGVFVDGLRDEFQDWVAPQRPATLDEAVRLAAGWEQAQSARAARRQNAASGAEEESGKCGFCDGGHEEAGCEVRRRMRELWLRSREEEAVGDERLAVVSAVEGEAAAVGRVVSMGRRSQCQCWKHRCWKKLERSSSAAVGDANDAPGDQRG